MSKTNSYVIDAEISDRIEDTPGGWEATDRLGIACVVAYHVESDRYLFFDSTSVEELCARLELATEIIGYNIWRFDLPLIFRQPARVAPSHLASKTNDLLRRIWFGAGVDPDAAYQHATHGWAGLDKIARATLGRGKTGRGDEAPVFWQAGQHVDVVGYCLNDVRLEAQLSRFIDRYGYVLDDDGRKIGVPRFDPLLQWRRL